MEELFLRTVTVSLAVSLLLLPLLFLRGWLEKRYAPQTRWLVWLGVAAVLLIAPLLPRMTAPVQVEVPARTVAYTQVGTAAPAAVPAPAPAVKNPVITPNQPIQPGMGAAAAPAPVTYRSVDWTELAAVLWLAVAAVLLAVQTVRYGVTRRRLFRASRPVESRKEAELRVLTGLETPIAMGFFRPVVFLPEEETDPMALRHELKHIQRRDTWGKAFLFLACALHWFNPLVWRMARWADQDVEACCDAAVVGEQDTAYKRAYGELLLASAAGERSLPFATRFGGGKEQMKSRLAQLFRPGKRSRVLVCALLASAVLLSGLVACTQQPPAEAAEPADGVYCSLCNIIDAWPVLEADSQETDYGSISLSLRAYDETGPQEDPLGEYTLPLSEDLTLWWYDGEEREIYGERGSFEWKRSVSDFLMWPMLRSSIPLGDDYLVVTVNDGEVTRLSWTLVDREGATLAQVLAGEAPFIDFDTGEAQYVNALPDSDGVPVTVCRYAKVDMDGDSTPELVLWLQRGEDEYQLGSIVLHYEDGLVRGYSEGFRSMNLLTLKTDGTYHWSAGASDNGWGRMGFPGGEEDTRREISWEGQEAKADATWYDFVTGEPLTRSEDLTYHAASLAFLNSMGCTDHDCTDPTHYHHCSEDCADPAHYHDCPEGCSDTGHHHPAAHHSETPVQPTVTHHPEERHSGHHG